MAFVAHHHDFLDVGRKAQAAFDELLGVAVPAGQLTQVVHAVQVDELAAVGGDGHRVAGAVPVAVQALRGLVGLAPVAGKAGAAAHFQFAGLGQPPLQRFAPGRAGGQRGAHGFGVHRPLHTVAADEAEFTAAVDVAQRHAHGRKEAEDIGRRRGAARDGRACVLQAQLLAQRCQHQALGQRHQPAAAGRYGLAARGIHAAVLPDAHAPVHQGLAPAWRVGHARVHQRGHALPLAWAKEDHLAGDLAHRLLDLVGPLGEVHAQRAHQAQRDADPLLGGPGQWDVGEVFAARLHAHAVADGAGVVLQRAVRGDHALGLAGGARGVGQQGDVLRAAQLHLARHVLRLGGGQRLASLFQGLARQHLGLAVAPQATGLPPHDGVHLRPAQRDGQGLVDLFLVFGKDAHGAGVFHHVVHLGFGGVRVERGDLGAQAQRGQLGPVLLGPVLADDDHGVAPLQAARGQAEGHGLHLGGDLAPGEFAPHAVALVALAHFGGPRGGVVGQPLRQGLRQGLLLGRVAHDFTPR